MAYLSVVHIDGLNRLYLMRVDVIAQQSHLVGADPDISTSVACHTIDVSVDAHTCQSQFFTDGGIPGVCTLVVAEEGTLSIEPDVIHLVGKGPECLRPAQFLVGDLVGSPNGMLLVHHVAADDTSVIIDDECTVLTLADGADDTLRYTLRVVGIAELIEQLLLHVIAYHTLVRDRSPEVLVSVDIDDAGDGLDTHPGEYLFHVALEALCLRMVDTITGSCLYQQVAVECLLHRVDITVRQRRAIL